MGVSAVVISGRLGIGGGEGDSIGRVGSRGGAMQEGGNVTGRDNVPVTRAGSTKYQLKTIDGQSLVPM